MMSRGYISQKFGLRRLKNPSTSGLIQGNWSCYHFFTFSFYRLQNKTLKGQIKKTMGAEIRRQGKKIINKQ